MKNKQKKPPYIHRCKIALDYLAERVFINNDIDYDRVRVDIAPDQGKNYAADKLTLWIIKTIAGEDIIRAVTVNREHLFPKLNETFLVPKILGAEEQ